MWSEQWRAEAGEEAELPLCRSAAAISRQLESSTGPLPGTRAKADTAHTSYTKPLLGSFHWEEASLGSKKSNAADGMLRHRGKLDLSRQNLPLNAALSSPKPQRWESQKLKDKPHCDPGWVFWKSAEVRSLWQLLMYCSHKFTSAEFGPELQVPLQTAWVLLVIPTNLVSCWDSWTEWGLAKLQITSYFR